jgi:ribonuclease P protein component
MLPQINRIKKKKDFDFIFKKGKSLKTSLLVFKILKNGLDYNRFASVVSLKVSKKAVVRNKIRRMFSAIMATKLKPADGIGKDIVIVAFSGIDKKPKEEIEQLINKII